MYIMTDADKADMQERISSITLMGVPEDLRVKGLHIVMCETDLSIQKLVVPDLVTLLETGTCSDENTLKEVQLNRDLREIQFSAISNCNNLKSVHFGKELRYIDNLAFFKCSNLNEYTVDKDNRVYSSVNGVLMSKDERQIIRVPDNIYKCYSIPEKVIEIGARSFLCCRSIVNLDIPNGVRILGSEAFGMCHKLRSVTIGEGVTHIDCGTFSTCDNLTTVKLSNKLKRIMGRAFEDCSNLRNINIPESVEFIDKTVFKWCEYLVITCIKGSYGEAFAIENEIEYKIV